MEVCFHSYVSWRLSRSQLTTRTTESWTPARPIRVSHTNFLEVGVTSNYLLTPCWLIMTADIDDRDQCLPGQSIVRRSVGVKATAPLDLFATLKIVLVDWRIDDRDRCLQGQSIVVIVISVSVITDLVRIALLWVINVMLVDHTEISTDRGDGL